MADHPVPADDQIYLARLTRALDRMPRQRRDLFLLVRIEGRSYREAGAIHRVGEAAARRQVSRAMLDLRRATRPQDFTLCQRLWPL